VVFSYAAEQADGHGQLAPLVAELGFAVVDAAALGIEPEARTVLPFEIAIDDHRLPALPDRVHRGGASVLQAQAACGFKAFAEHRLWSTELETQEPGMDARERGNIVHEVMERFWRGLQSQANLQALSQAAREELLDRSIDATLTATAGKMGASSPWDMAYMGTQHQRLRALLRPWIDLECARPPFTVRERELTLEDVAVGPLRLRVRVDRVDDTEGGPLIVDYKTGAATPREWLGERPDAPQLPLYAIAANAEQLGGVAFALLRAGDDLDLAGYAVDGTVLAKTAKMDTASLAEQVDEWRRVLTNLAEQFHAGEAWVDPKQYPKTCQRCAQRLLCRLDPATLEAFEDEEQEEVERG
jgi:hypothetical protein